MSSSGCRREAGAVDVVVDVAVEGAGAPVFAAQAEGHDIRIVESLAPQGKLNDLQRCFTAHHALQCGFCTPGFLMLAEGFLAGNPNPSREDVREVVSANLCRCTGYQTIVDAIAACAAGRREAAPATDTGSPPES